jgi:hypothetical protein
MKFKKVIIVLSAVSSVLVGCKSEALAIDQTATPTNVTSGKSVTLNDVNDHWAKNAINQAISKGYVEGYEDATFRPDLNVTRAEFLKMVAVSMKLPITGNTTGSEWYKPYVTAATNKGILQESDIPLEEMTKPISRLEMARLAVRSTDKAFQLNGVYIDDNSVMYNAAKSGLIQGLSYGELGPDKPTNRAQSVTIIERILTVSGGGKLPVDKYAVSSAELALKRTNIFSVMPEIFGGTQVEGEFASKWDPKNLVLETSDGKYKGELDQIIAIDLEDPNDPNRGLLADFDQLRWVTPSKHPIDPFIKDYPKSYVILYKVHTDFNKDEVAYSKYFSLGLGIDGIRSPDEDAFVKGTLNTLATVYKNKLGDINAFILPKTGYSHMGIVNLSLHAPAIPPQSDYQKVILSVGRPK